jgi:hypothetical protein
VVAGAALAAAVLVVPTENLWVLVAVGVSAYLAAMTALRAIVFESGKLPSVRL